MIEKFPFDKALQFVQNEVKKKSNIDAFLHLLKTRVREDEEYLQFTQAFGEDFMKDVSPATVMKGSAVVVLDTILTNVMTSGKAYEFL